VFEWLRENTTAGKVAAKKLAVYISLGLAAMFFLSCGGSTGDDPEAESEEVIFAPVVYIADKVKNGTAELYVSLDDGADIRKLSGTLVSGGNVVDFEVSPDGIWVAYVADQDTNDLFELYVVPVDKTSNESAVKVSVALAGTGIKETTPGSGDYNFAWAPDSSRLAYIADAAEEDPDPEVADLFELFSSTPDGKEKDQISELVDAASDVVDFQWEPESTLIAYVADQDTIGKIELYVAPSDGDDLPVKVSGAMTGSGIEEDPAGSGEYAFAWAPDSSRLAYIADQLALGKFELFSSTPDGTGNLLISGPFGINQDVQEFAWAPNNQRIAYTANQIDPLAIELFSAPPDVPTSSRINSRGVAPGEEVSTFKWAPDSSRIAFITNKDSVVTDFFRLFSVQPVNNLDIDISGGLNTADDVIDFDWAPDSSRIAYLVDSQDFDLYTTLPDWGSSIQIKGDGVTDGDVFEFEWAPNSSRIAYTADHDVDDVIELFSSTPDNSDTNKVSGDLVTGGDVGEFKWATDSSGVGYIANQDTINLDELYASRPNGNDNTLLSDPPEDENDDPIYSGDVSAFEWVPEDP
jgi:hypothetical protein